jgi:hypothetical protein
MQFHVTFMFLNQQQNCIIIQHHMLFLKTLETVMTSMTHATELNLSFGHNNVFVGLEADFTHCINAIPEDRNLPWKCAAPSICKCYMPSSFLSGFSSLWHVHPYICVKQRENHWMEFMKFDTREFHEFLCIPQQQFIGQKNETHNVFLLLFLKKF